MACLARLDKFGIMNLRSALLTVVLATAPVLATFAADKPSSNTNAPLVVVTNTPPPPATNEVKEIKDPEDIFTNSVDMVLLKVGGFWAGKFPVTQAEFQKIMGYNPSAFGGGTRPVDSVSWQDAMDFCKKMTEKDLKEEFLPKGYYYTLPTEDEWQSLVGDASLDTAVTSLGANSHSATSPVGSLAANNLGLYDIRGNVSEFCLSDESKPYRVLKGGSWQDFTEINLRPDFRWYAQPDERRNTFGFRCLLKSGDK